MVYHVVYVAAQVQWSMSTLVPLIIVQCIVVE